MGTIATDGGGQPILTRALLGLSVALSVSYLSSCHSLGWSQRTIDRRCSALTRRRRNLIGVVRQRGTAGRVTGSLDEGGCQEMHAPRQSGPCEGGEPSVGLVAPLRCESTTRVNTGGMERNGVRAERYWAAREAVSEKGGRTRGRKGVGYEDETERRGGDAPEGAVLPCHHREESARYITQLTFLFLSLSNHSPPTTSSTTSTSFSLSSFLHTLR